MQASTLYRLAALRSWLAASLHFFFPEGCQICRQRRATPAQGFVCEQCRRGVRYIAPPFCSRCGMPYAGAITVAFECANCADLDLRFDSARSAVVARDPVLEIIHRYKYNRAMWFEPFLAELLVRAAAPALAGAGWSAIVPVPLHPTKQREREFNQAECLGQHLSRATGIPLRPKLLQRVRPTLTQTHLSREQRQQNVHRAFALRRPGSLENQRLVLLDDVFTTGATTNACARVLREAGAASVCVWTVARGL